MKEVNRETLIAKIKSLQSRGNAEYSIGLTLNEEFQLSAFKMLLTAMDSEPVAEVIQKLNGYDRPLYVVAIEGDVEEGDALYRHAQPCLTRNN